MIYTHDEHVLKDSLYEKVAQAYFDLGKLDEALKAFKLRLLVDKKKENLFVAEVVKEFLNRRARVRAIWIIDNRLSDVKLQNSLLVKVALSYYFDANDDMVQTIVQKILTSAFKKEMENSDTYSNWDRCQKILRNNQEGANKLFSALARDCCQKLKHDFSANDEGTILTRITNKAEAVSTKYAFFALASYEEFKGSNDRKGSSHFRFDSDNSDSDSNDPFSSYSYSRHTNFAYASSSPKESQYSAPAKRKDVYIPDQYKILGLPNGATKEQVKKAHRALCLEKHPDKVTDESAKQAATKEIQKLNAAYEALRHHLGF